MTNKTYGEMFDKVKRKVGLTNTFNDGTDETASLKEDINDIQKEVLTISKTYLQKAGINIVGGTVATQKEYDIPTTVDKITLVKVTVDSRDYFPSEIGIQDFNRLANTEVTSDIPVYYTIDKTKLVLYPTPETSSLPIELNANQYATDLNIDPDASTDQATALEIKEGYENVIYYYALNEAYERQEDYAAGDRQLVKHEKLMKDYKKEVRNPTNNLVIKSGINRQTNPNYYNTLTN